MRRTLEQIRAAHEAIVERQRAKEESYQERAAVRYKKLRDCNRRYRETNREKVNAWERARRAALTDAYIANTLLNARTAECPHDIIELKRQQIQIFRLTKQLNKTLREISHE